MSKPFRKLLIANRAEIAIRIARAAEELGIATLAVYAEDDAHSLHVRRADQACALRGSGARAYLDIEQLLALAKAQGCDALHPGYGFLSESSALAQGCEANGVTFVGPTSEQLTLLGDKLQARALASSLDVPLARGSGLLDDVAAAHEYFAQLGGPAMLKAAHGGGGRGMRAVQRADELDEAFARCRSEAELAFGNGALYMEELLVGARHIELQVLGDGQTVSQLGERECSLQRRNQKLVELAPSPTLRPETRHQLAEATLRMARQVGYRSLGTFEFLLAADGQRFVFMEANPRLQVEHTVTEEVLGIDLVKAQLQVAQGATLAALGLTQQQLPPPRGHAIQLRVNLERIDPTGAATPASGTLSAYEPPAGPGVRVDGAAFAGYTPSASYDSLLLKLIVHAPQGGYAAAVRKARRALSELRLEGIANNVAFLRQLVDEPAFASNALSTTYLAEHGARLAAACGAEQTALPQRQAPEGLTAVVAPLRGRVLSIELQPGASVRAGQALAIIEAMKMESVVGAPCAGQLREVLVHASASVDEGQPLFWLAASEDMADGDAEPELADEEERSDLREVRARHDKLRDAHRPGAVEKRRKTGQRTARENVADLCDEGSFFEYGGLALAAQRSTRAMDTLIDLSPADGVVTGIGTVNGALFGAEAARCMVVAYDYTVFAGTQGLNNHKKQDRVFELAAQQKLPVVLLAEGGGGRPGDTDMPVRPTLDVETFHTFATLSGRVPLVGVVSGRCFAGNAVLLGCCDVIIATENANIGMGGPVMIEGAGLGSFPPEAVGPIDVQSKNGVVDVRVADEAEGVAVAKRYLAFFQGKLADYREPDVHTLRSAVPENRRRGYDMRRLIGGLLDLDSQLELRREFGTGMITMLGRIEGRTVGVIANEPTRLAGAIDAEGADKAARFMRLCDAYHIPLISLCDTPGFMVGPEAEQTAMVRRTCRMLVAAGNMRVPLFCVVVRKAYGLGAMAMAGGHMHAPFFSVAWPTGEFGAMGLEGAVQLAFKKQLNAIADPVEREKLLRKMADGLRHEGRATNIASHLEIDDVIDPAETRSWLARGLRALPPRSEPREPRFIDTW